MELLPLITLTARKAPSFPEGWPGRAKGGDG